MRFYILDSIFLWKDLLWKFVTGTNLSNDDDTFEKFSHKAKLIRQRKDDTYKAKRKEKLERMEFEENATKGED